MKRRGAVKLLVKHGYQLKRQKGGHDAYVKKGAARPFVLPRHGKDVPQFIVGELRRLIRETTSSGSERVLAGVGERGSPPNGPTKPRVEARGRKKRVARIYDVPLHWHEASGDASSSHGWASAVGNNAAWNCRCDRETPLIGSTMILPEVSCRCGRKYRVVAEKGRGTPAIRVEELPTP